MFYAVSELLSVETNESFAYASIFERTTDPHNGHVEEENVDYLILLCLLGQQWKLVET